MILPCKLRSLLGGKFTNMFIIRVTFDIEDVRNTIDMYDIPIKLTDDECLDVLYILHDNHDANYGICWDTIYYVIHDQFKDKIEKGKKK